MGYWPSIRSRWLDIGQVLVCVFLNSQKKSGGQYPAILLAFEKIFLAGYSGLSRAGKLHLARSSSQSQRRIWFILLAHGATILDRIKWEIHWKLRGSVSAPKCQFSPAGQSPVQPFLEPFERNLGHKSYIKRLFQHRVGPIPAQGPNQP